MSEEEKKMEVKVNTTILIDESKEQVLNNSVYDNSKKMNNLNLDEKVTFNTNIKISNHTRNRLQALANLGYASSQKDAIDLIFSAYLDTLLDSEKKELELQIDVLERKDAKLKKK